MHGPQLVSSSKLGDVVMNISESVPPITNLTHPLTPMEIVYRVVDQVTNVTRYFQKVRVLVTVVQMQEEAKDSVTEIHTRQLKAHKCIALCPPNSVDKTLRTLLNKRQTCFFYPRTASCLCLLSLLCTYALTYTPRFLQMNLSL